MCPMELHLPGRNQSTTTKNSRPTNRQPDAEPEPDDDHEHYLNCSFTVSIINTRDYCTQPLCMLIDAAVFEFIDAPSYSSPFSWVVIIMDMSIQHST